MATLNRASSISQQGTTEDFLFQVGRRKIAKHATFTRYGRNPEIGQTAETIWNNGGLYNFLSSAIQLNVSSSSAQDDTSGTGARTIQIIGLDANFSPIAEVLTLDGQTVVTTASPFRRVIRAVNLTAGSGNVNAGDIYIHNSAVTAGVPNNLSLVYAKISAGNGQTEQAVYTVPAGFTGYITAINFLAGRIGNSDFASFEVRQRVNNGTLNAQRVIFEVDSSANNTVIPFTPPVQIIEKSDLWINAFKNGTQSRQLSASFSMVIVNEVDPVSVTISGVQL